MLEVHDKRGERLLLGVRMKRERAGQRYLHHREDDGFGVGLLAVVFSLLPASLVFFGRWVLFFDNKEAGRGRGWRG